MADDERGGLPRGLGKINLRRMQHDERDNGYIIDTGQTERDAPTQQAEYFQDFFGENDEDAELATVRAQPAKFSENEYNRIEDKLNRNFKKLREENPATSLRSWRFVTAEVLLEAPKDFFVRFEDAAKEVTSFVQGSLSEKGAADLIGQAKDNPFDEEIQESAFKAVQGIAVEYMERLPYKGIERSIVIYLACMDIVGMSRMDPLWRNRDIDEILCNGPFDIQIEMKGKLYNVPGCQFRDAEHLEAMLERIFSSLGKSLSRTTPYLDGRLYDQSRIAATHRVISPAGPNVAIRRHPEKYWTPMDLIAFNSSSEELWTHVGNMIHKGCSYIVIGGTSSGKTSLLNATSCFFDAEQRVLTLEDNLELRLNPNKRVGAPMEVVPPNPNKPGDTGTTMRDLVRATLRMRPDGIVVGEVRDGAMYDLCQALNTGHWGASTVHANSPFDGIYRMQSLVTQADLVTSDAALPLIAAAFDFIIMQEHFPEDGSRKVTAVAEIDPYPSVGDDGRLHLGVRELWKFNTKGVVDGKVTGTWDQVGELSDIRRERRHLDLTPDLTWPELVELCKV